MIKFIKHFLHHLMFCMMGCTLYHLIDAYFGITSRLFQLLGIGFR